MTAKAHPDRRKILFGGATLAAASTLGAGAPSGARAKLVAQSAAPAAIAGMGSRAAAGT